MKKLRSILLATDLRSTNQDVANVAIRLASAEGARVTLLHVLEPISRLSATPTAILSGLSGPLHIEPTFGSFDVTQARRNVSEIVLRDVAAHLTSQKVGLGESTILVGSVADSIVQKANDIDADLILMGAGERFGDAPGRAWEVAA